MRWTLNRAGITNVYQYAEETLRFGGGRLLLRGVNGSGKSTAMNMLLPFLLEADARRIDAAGEQSGVLRSWMLSGRDEIQPVGYLWVEFRRGDEYTVCGCGIRANRNTDRVTTWWFITDQRPGIDFKLVEGRVPISADALRSILGDQAVFTHDQRTGYRSAARARLFGGVDLDPHIRLLHVVRNPRVGDRIDVDLPNYLQDALPPLSDSAIDDAAQPLEDLEEHRRNVENLSTTAQALEALTTIYRGYASTELASRADRARSVVRDASTGRRVVDASRKAAELADQEMTAADELIAELTDDEERLDSEIAALQATPAYQSGQELDDLRRHVSQLSEVVEAAVVDEGRASERRDRAATATKAAHRVVATDHDALKGVLSDLATSAGSVGIDGQIPELLNATASHGEIPEPEAPLDVTRSKSQTSDMLGATNRRRAEIDDVMSALAITDAAEQALALAERDRRRGEESVTAAEHRQVEARAGLHAQLDEWRDALLAWWEELASTAIAHDIDIQGPRTDLDGIGLIDLRHDAYTEAVAAADRAADEHRRRHANAAGRLADQLAEVQKLTGILDELNRTELPAPPAQTWQRHRIRPSVTELIDFAPHVPDDDRRGLEAAMEAAGLLGAELETDGSLRLTSGELVAVATDAVDAPLSEMIVVAAPDAIVETELASLARVLGSISTDLESAAATVVSVDGGFRIGALSGRHRKDVVEHIGAGARKASLERQREAASVALDAADQIAASTQEAVDEHQRRTEATIEMRRAIATPAPVSDALAGLSGASEELEHQRSRLAGLATAEHEAEAAHTAAVGNGHRLAARLRLPADRPGLASMSRLVDEVATLSTRVDALLDALARSHSAWTAAVTEWRLATDDHRAAVAALADRRGTHERTAARLATLEDSIGLEYADVLASLDVARSDLAGIRSRLPQVRSERDRALEQRSRHQAETEAARTDLARLEEECRSELEMLRGSLDVPGLVATVFGSGEVAGLPVVTSSPDGLGELAAAIVERVSQPPEAVTAEGVRQSLRRRRDTLGAGWDAQDHQPSPGLPLSIEINGPLGRMSLADAMTEVSQHRDRQASLLSAKQDQALRNLLQGLIAREVSDKLASAGELVRLMNRRLETVSTAHGIGARLRWRRRDNLDPALGTMIDLLAKPPDLRTPEEDDALTTALSTRIADARTVDPERGYRDLVREVLDYRTWHDMSVYVRRAGQPEQRLTRRTPLSEGEKKIVSYLPLFAAVAASSDAIADVEPSCPRFVLLDDAFAKVSEDNHARLFGLLVEMDLDFIATSERLWGTHATVPELAITEVIRDADLGVILLEHSTWNGRSLEQAG